MTCRHSAPTVAAHLNRGTREKSHVRQQTSHFGIRAGDDGRRPGTRRHDHGLEREGGSHRNRKAHDAPAKRADDGDHAHRHVRSGQRRRQALRSLPAEAHRRQGHLEGSRGGRRRTYSADRAASGSAGQSRCHAQGLARGDRRRRRQDQGHRTRRASRRRDSRIARQRRHECCGKLSAPHPARRLCADGHPGRLDDRCGDALGDGKGRAVPPRPAPRPRLRRSGPTTTTKSANSAGATAPNAAPSRPISAASGSSRGRRRGIRSCARSRPRRSST